MSTMLGVRAKLNHRIFKAVHRRNLIYNACWEDPAARPPCLEPLRPDDRVLVHQQRQLQRGSITCSPAPVQSLPSM